MKDFSSTSPSGDSTPINVAPPVWECPHCHTRFGADFDKAAVCAALGPADPVEPGVFVLNLRASFQRGAATFGVTEVGKVAVEYDAGTPVRHRCDVSVNGTNVDVRKLAGASPGQLVVLTDTGGFRHPGDDPQGYGTSYGYSFVDALFGMSASPGTSTKPKQVAKPSRWIPAERWTHHSTWWGPLGDRERALAEMLVGSRFAALVEADPAALAASIVESYTTDRIRRSAAYLPTEKFFDLSTSFSVAQAHGAPNLIWARRWLAAHLDDVALWQATAVQAWASGAEVTVPRMYKVGVSANLPKKPGKARNALMEGYGRDYDSAWRALDAAISVPAPGPVVPGLGDVVTELRGHGSRGPIRKEK